MLFIDMELHCFSIAIIYYRKLILVIKRYKDALFTLASFLAIISLPPGYHNYWVKRGPP